VQKAEIPQREVYGDHRRWKGVLFFTIVLTRLYPPMTPMMPEEGVKTRFRATILPPSATDLRGTAWNGAEEPTAETQSGRAFSTQGGTGRDNGGRVRFPPPPPRERQTGRGF
jgi:hypothetical protein